MTKKEEGLRELRIYFLSSWKSYPKIGRYLIHRYGLLEKYLKLIKEQKEIIKRYKRVEKLKELGLLVYREYCRGPWRGFYEIKQYIMHRYKLVDADLYIVKKEKKKYYMRNYRKKVKKKSMVK